MARLLTSVLGHQQEIERLLSAIEQNHLPHAMLFVGTSGIGKRTVAFAIAQALLCEKNPKACGVCGGCLRAEKAFHDGVGSEGLLSIAPEKNQIKIDQAKEILEFLNLRSLSKNRVIIIDGADCLNPQAANSLLKVIEEPPQNTFFILMAPSPSHVISTIRSRSQIVRFSPLGLEDMKKKAIAPEWALKASGGSFEKLSMLTDRAELEIRESAVAFLDAWMKNPDYYLLPEFRDLVRDREGSRKLYRHLNLLLKDAVYTKLNAKEQISNVDKMNLLNNLSNYDIELLMTTAQKALEIEGALDSNRDSSLVYEQFWLETRPVVS